MSLEDNLEKINKNNKKELGQYYTTNLILKEKIYEFIKNNPLLILEPSMGRGDLVDYILSKNNNIKFDMYEIDNSIKLLNNINKNNVNYCNFLNVDIIKKYDTIVGNPPYVKTKSGNLYIDFIDKCFNLLNLNGELIFIIPSDFFKLTSASKLINKMIKCGSFTDIYHPNKENLFENASIDILIFRYIKNNILEKKVLYNDKYLNIINNNGILIFEEDNNNEKVLIKKYFDIYVGMVSGKDDVFKNEIFGNINLLNGQNKNDKFIFINEFPTNNNLLNEYLLVNKNNLLSRKIKKFDETNWFKWGAPRNYKTILNNFNKDCIYVNNLTRNNKIAFIDKVKYFGGNIILMIPKFNINLNKITDYLNSNDFKKNYTYSNRFKIGHKQLENSLIPANIL